jgi:hypothetical protein
MSYPMSHVSRNPFTEEDDNFHVLAGKSPAHLEGILGHRFNRFDLFISCTHETSLKKATSPIPFTRVEVNLAFLEKVGQAQTFIDQADAEAMTFNEMPVPYGAPNQGGGQGDWTLHCSKTEFWFTMKSSAVDGVYRDVFESVRVNTHSLLAYLDVGYQTRYIDPESLERLGDYVKILPKHVLISDTDESFLEAIVAPSVPEVQAELTAEAMRKAVSENADQFKNTKVREGYDKPTPRRRRMGA